MGSSYSVGFSLPSEHSKGYRKLDRRFSNFPEAVRTVAALTSSSLLVVSFLIYHPKFQVPLGELSFRNTTSPFLG